MGRRMQRLVEMEMDFDFVNSFKQGVYCAIEDTILVFFERQSA